MPNFAFFKGSDDAEISQKHMLISLLIAGLGAESDVVCAAFHDGDGGHQGQLGFPLEVGDGGDTAVAHGGLDLVQGGLHVVVEGAGVGYSTGAACRCTWQTGSPPPWGSGS